jgi:hypothetical protein
MTKKQFDEACARHGFEPHPSWSPFASMGYYKLPSGVNVSILNAGSRRRDQLAYLIRESERDQARKELAATR